MMNKERLKNNIKKNRFLFLVITIVWVALVVATLFFYKDSLGKNSVGNYYYENVCELNEDNAIDANVEVYDGTQSIALKFATYARKNNGDLFISVIGNDSKTVYLNGTYSASSIQDNAYAVMSLDETIYLKNDKTITIKISADSKKDNGVGVYYSNNKFFEDSSLNINNQKMSGDLTVRFLMDDDTYYSFNEGVLIFIITIMSLLIAILILLEPKLEVMFTLMVLTIGLIFGTIMTPCSPPDEGNHYEFSFQLSNIMMFKDNYHDIDVAYVNYDNFGGHYNTANAYYRLMNKFNNDLHLKDDYYTPSLSIDDQYLVYYIPQALGITFARLFNLNMLKTFYMGRLFNLLFYVACVYIALKNVPTHKLLFGIISTLPMFLQQASSYSYDAFINGLTLMSISFLLKWIFVDKKIPIKEYILVFLTSLALAPAKIVYGCFAFLYWFVPSERFGSKKKKIIMLLILIAPSVYYILYMMLPRIMSQIRRWTTVYASEITYVDSDGVVQVKYYDFNYAIENLDQTLKVFYTTIRYNIKNWFYSAIGYIMSGESLVLPLSFAHIMTIIIIISSLRKEDYIEGITLKFSYLGVCIIIGLFILTGMLLGWTKRDAETIQGIQGRYFCPLLPYFFAILSNKKIAVNQKFDKYVILSQIFLLFEIIIYILSYTFINNI